jgi:hypothetical protein
MPGLVPGIHVFGAISKKDVDGRDKPGHDENGRRKVGKVILIAIASALLTAAQCSLRATPLAFSTPASQP